MKKFIQKVRLWLSFSVFPYESSFHTNDRTHFHYKNKNKEYVFLVVSTEGKPSFTKEEMIVTLDGFLGREITQEEWDTFLSWRYKDVRDNV